MSQQSDQPSSLSWRLFIATGVLVVLLTVSLTLIAGGYATARIWDDQGHLLSATAARIANQVDQALAERWQDISKVSTLRLFRAEDGESAQQRRRLDSLAKAFPEYAWIGYTNAQGEVLIATDGLLEGADVSQRPWWVSASQQPFIGDIHGALLLQALLRPDSGEPLRFVDVAAPVRDDQGRLTGVIGAHLYTEWVAALVEAVVRTADDMQGARVLIINNNEQLIVGPPGYDLAVGAPGSANLASSDRLGHLREPWTDGTMGVTGYAKADGFRDFPGLGWRVMVHRPEADIVAPVRRLQLRMAVAGGVIAALSMLVAVLLLRSVTRPMRQLALALSDVSEIAELEALQIANPFRELHSVVTRLQGMARRIRHSEAQLTRQRRLGREQADQIQSLHRSATTDSLTGALNRRGLDDRLRRLGDSLTKYPRPVGVIAMDLDHFKAINDSYGHPAGDHVLEQVARHAAGMLRATDIFARSGGEEFLIILPETERGQAAELAERLRSAIECFDIQHQGRSINITASFGVAAEQNPQGLVRLMREADAQCYAAKQAGRNQVSTAPD